MSECKNCGADEALHHYDTNQCPKNGVEEQDLDEQQEWSNTTFEYPPTDEKQEWYKKLWNKLHKIELGELTLSDYIKEVESKIYDKS